MSKITLVKNDWFTQVKFFCGSGYDIEKGFNEWAMEHPNLHIDKTASTEKGLFIFYTIDTISKLGKGGLKREWGKNTKDPA